MRILGCTPSSDGDVNEVIIDFENGKLVNYESEYLPKEMFDKYYNKSLKVFGYTDKLRFGKSQLNPETLENALYVLNSIFGYNLKGDLPEWFTEEFPYEEGVVY